MSFKLQLRFRTDADGLLFLEETRFGSSDKNANWPLVVLLEDTIDRKYRKSLGFRWRQSPGVRGMAVLMLRHFGEPDVKTELRGMRGSLAASLVEAITDVHRKGPNWVTRMFGHNSAKERIPRELFECTDGSATDNYRARAGSGWKGGEIVVTLDGTIIHPDGYFVLASRLEAEAPIVVLGSLNLWIARSGQIGELGDKKWEVLDAKAEGYPPRNGDFIKVSARVNRDAYLYLVWLSPEGEAFLMCPWYDGCWPDAGSKVCQRTAPLVDTREIEITSDQPGVETILFLASPKPVDLLKLKNMLEGMPVISPWQMTKIAVALKITGRSVTKPLRKPSPDTRGPNFKPSMEQQHPLDTRHERLKDRLELEGFSFGHALSFPSQPG